MDSMTSIASMVSINSMTGGFDYLMDSMTSIGLMVSINSMTLADSII